MSRIKSDKFDYNIEVLRGLAILLVVAGHVIGSTPDGGMRIDFPSPFRYIYLWIDYIQMPLFTAIAGWVYAIRPVNANTVFFSFTKKKALRILLPMMTVGTLYFLMQYISPGTNHKGVLSEMWRIYVFPYTIYWYLPSLFIMFILMYIIDINNLASSLKKWTPCFLIILLLAMVVLYVPAIDLVPNFYSFKGAVEQMPYFLIGVALYRFKNLLSCPEYIILYIVGTIIALALMNVEWFYPESIPGSCYKLMVIFTLPLMLNIQSNNKYLIYIGKYAYSIYLFHVFFTGGIRIILIKLGLNSEIVIFTIAFIIATAAPIFIHNVLKRNKTTSLLFLGR